MSSMWSNGTASKAMMWLEKHAVSVAVFWLAINFLGLTFTILRLQHLAAGGA
jgi:hypothetical protein